MKSLNKLNVGILCVIVFALAGCAPTQVTLLSETTMKLPRPDRIMVYNFAVSPDEVKLDRGISNQIEAYVNKKPGTAEEKAVGRGVANSVGKHLVADRTERMGGMVTGPWWGRQYDPVYGRVIIAVAIRYVR